jgi:DNA invertase Pin-like site-specific DNA recombinase
VHVKAAIYLRVSTERQDTANQAPALEALARQRGFEVEWHEETASGAKARPILDQLCARGKRGEVQALIVWSIDRLGRNMPEVVDRVRQLDAARVLVISHAEPWLAVDGPARELLLSIFAWVSQFERQRLRERTLAGLARARAQGRVGGRPPASPLALAAAEALHAGGLSLTKAARRVGVGRATLSRYLARTREAA